MELLTPTEGGFYLDGTTGLGGHSSEIMRRTQGTARLCCLDQDEQALDCARETLAPWGDAVTLVRSRFSACADVLQELGWPLLQGALIDIGVSSLQIDSAARGFSFMEDGPLDMRMDAGQSSESAWHLVNRGRFETLKDIIERYGEDPQAGRIARAIVDARDKKSIESTHELAYIVERAYPAAWRAKARNHPATRTFQALRMAVNDELGELERFLHNILPCLAVGGRLVVISFHSLEDRMVKHQMRSWAEGCRCPRHIPRCICGHTPEVRLLNKKPLSPSEEECKRNPRARSAHVRAVEKCRV